MRKIAPLNIKIRRSDSGGIFHDSRGDVRLLSQALNAILEKQNEIIRAVNALIQSK